MATIVEPETTKPAAAGPRHSVPQAVQRPAPPPGGPRRSRFSRLEPLAQQDMVSKQQLDAVRAAAVAADAQLASAQAALVGADARVAAARAARDQAALQLSYTRLLAPTSGVVSKKTVEVGQLVQPGQPLMSVVPLDDVWVVANLKETQTADVTSGDPVDFTVDAYPGRHFAGRVESLSPAPRSDDPHRSADNTTELPPPPEIGFPPPLRKDNQDRSEE